MKRIKNFVLNLVKKPYFIPLLIVIAFAILAGKGLIGSGYFNMHDDLQMMRQLEMEKCFLDLQIPCRWVPDMGYGFGYPLFNFYPPLPYLVGEILRSTGIPFVDTAKDLFILSFVASGITMYFLAKEFFGRFGGVVSSIFYVWAPYHAVDIYVRGAMNEAWALIWFPLILWSSYKLITKKEKLFPWIIGLALGFFGLLTSHNLMVLIFTPLFGLWCLIWIVKYHSGRKIPQLIFAGIFAFCLAAFFTLPVLLEQKLVQTDTLVKGYYEYTAHFVTFGQMFISRFWGYGPSVWGDGDGMSFQIGQIHWTAAIIVGVATLIMVLKKKKLNDLLISVPFMVLAGFIAAFMTHNKSTPIWQLVRPLAYVQFPWRFLTIVILGFSFAAGSLAVILPKSLAKFILPIIVIGLIVFSWNYFNVQNSRLGALADQQKFSGVAWDLQQTAGIFDYLPKYAVTAPKEPQSKEGLTEVMKGQAKVTNPSQKSNFAGFDIDVADTESQVRVSILKFDGWRAYVDGRETEIYVPKEEAWGRSWIKVPKGVHKITFRFTNTPIRTAGNAISLVSWVSLPVLIIWRKRFSFLA